MDGWIVDVGFGRWLMNEWMDGWMGASARPQHIPCWFGVGVIDRPPMGISPT